MKVGVLIFILAFVLMATFVGSRNLPRLYSLSKNSRTERGTVVKTDPANHNTYYYTYRINDRVYLGDGEIPQRGVKVGDNVNIVYSMDRPEWSSDKLGNLKEALNSELMFVVTASLLASVVITGSALQMLDISLNDAFTDDVKFDKEDLLCWFRSADTSTGSKD